MRLSVLIILFIIQLNVYSQQHHRYNNYNFNQYSINPAIAGTKPCNTLHFGNKQQWVGFEGAPNVVYTSFHTSLNKQQRFPKRIHGFGFYLANEKEGIQKTTYVKLSYAYHLKMWRNLKASVGLFVGFQQRKLNIPILNTPRGQIDPAFENNPPEYVFPEISPGIYIHNKDLYAGLSLFQLYPKKFKKIGSGKSNLDPHIFIMGGYHFRTAQFKYTPSFLFSYAPLLSPTMDFSISANYRNLMSVGLGAKYVNSGYAMLELRIFSWLKAAYTYEYAFSQFKHVAAVTHEIILRISACEEVTPRPQMFCPVYN